MISLDFIHVGFHKTASTWLQLHALKAHPDIVMVNDSTTDLDPLFMKSFVWRDDLEFTTAEFEQTFISEFLKKRPHKDGKIYGICEENLSGHYWNGVGAKSSAERILETFGPVKVVIVIRQQFDMLRSLYGNYVKNGGMQSLRGLLEDREGFWGGRIYDKLRYDRLIGCYERLFTKEKVHVLCYEDLRDAPQETMDKFFSFVGASPHPLPKGILGRRVNPGLSAPSECAMRWLNRLGGNLRWPQKALRAGDRLVLRKIFPPGVSGIERDLDPSQVDLWRQSNRILAESRKLPLAKHGYPL